MEEQHFTSNNIQKNELKKSLNNVNAKMNCENELRKFHRVYHYEVSYCAIG